jgi:hypothetical protein
VRHLTTVVVCLVSVAVAHASRHDIQQKDDAAAILARARTALGGDARLAAITSFVATGRTRRLQGENLVPIEFEIACELPDKFVRRDEIPAQESGPTSKGFNGDGLIQLPLPPPRPPAREGAGRGGAPPAGRAGEPPAGRAGDPPGRAGGPPAARAGGPPDAAAPPKPPGPAFTPPKSDPLSASKQDFVRLTLGMFATSFSAYPMTFTRIGQAQAPQGTAEVIEARGPEGSNFVLRLFVNGQTHVPIMVSWQMPASNVIVTVPGQAKPTTLAPGTVVVEGPPVPPADASKEDVAAFTKTVADLRRKAQATLVEHRLYYADYRDVNGVQLPFRLRRAIGADTIEETNFDEFRINPRIDPRKFEVVK